MDNMADVQFQATTRGGRRMDAILKGKVAFKRTTVGIGASLTEAGSQAGGLGGLGVALLGAMIQGIGGAVTPEADTRCWKTLPAEFLVVPLNLTPGEHEIVFSQNIYFEKRAAASRRFVLAAPDDFKFLCAPPSLAGQFSFSATVDRSGAKKRAAVPPVAATGPILLLPPVLGLGQIEKFPSDDQTKRPRAFAPDVRRLGQLEQQALATAGFVGMTVTHAEALEQIAGDTRPCGVALQCELLGLDLKITDRQESFLAEFEFTPVNVPTGRRVFERRITGEAQRSGKFECTEAFYSTFEAAFAQLLSAPEFVAAVKEFSAPAPSVKQSPTGDHQ
jgi:hypothetical protein